MWTLHKIRDLIESAVVDARHVHVSVKTDEDGTAYLDIRLHSTCATEARVRALLEHAGLDRIVITIEP